MLLVTDWFGTTVQTANIDLDGILSLTCSQDFLLISPKKGTKELESKVKKIKKERKKEKESKISISKKNGIINIEKLVINIFKRFYNTRNLSKKENKPRQNLMNIFENIFYYAK